MTPEEHLTAFHWSIDEKPFIERDAYGRRKGLELRRALITEEYHEVMDEFADALAGDGDYAQMAKELADLVVVVVGTAQLLDIPFDTVFDEVMRSNMSKIPKDGNVIRRDDGKVLKPDTYTPADLSFLSDPFGRLG